jgi:hypothetical protein
MHFAKRNLWGKQDYGTLGLLPLWLSIKRLPVKQIADTLALFHI